MAGGSAFCRGRMKTLQKYVSVSLYSHQRITRSLAYLFDEVQVFDILLFRCNDLVNSSRYTGAEKQILLVMDVVLLAFNFALREGCKDLWREWS